jgi:hypothetical protein
MISEERRAHDRKYYKDNAEEFRAYSRKYYKNNLKRCRQLNRNYYLRNTRFFMLKRAQLRARVAQLPFNLTLEDIVIPKKCPVLGIELKVGRGRLPRNSPSLDRVKPHKGYVKGNVAVISNRANILKKDGTLEEFQALVKWLKKQ